MIQLLLFTVAVIFLFFELLIFYSLSLVNRERLLKILEHTHTVTIMITDHKIQAFTSENTTVYSGGGNSLFFPQENIFYNKYIWTVYKVLRG